MNNKVPVKQALMMCFYSIEKEILKKQCGSNIYFWKYLPDGNSWRFIVTSTNIKPPAIWISKEFPNELVSPETIYNMEAEHSPEQWYVSEKIEVSNCIFDSIKYFEYMIHGENS